MPVSERAEVGVRRKVVAQPCLLLGPRRAAAAGPALRVEGDDVPAADVVAVVRLPRDTRTGGAEVTEESGCAVVGGRAASRVRGGRRDVLVVSDRGVCDRLDASPRCAVRRVERREAAALVLVV